MLGKKIGLWGSWFFGALGTLSQSAHASSTFETGPAEAVKAQAQLDFTIHIPLVLTLERPAFEESSRAEEPAMSVTWKRSPDLEPFSATSNGGTLVVTPPISGDGQSRALRPDKQAAGSRVNRAYLVAMP